MTLAKRQADLVAALVCGGPAPAGFSERHLAATRAALLAKRAEEVKRVWPELAGAYADGWGRAFAGWAGGKLPQGALRDGFDFAIDHRPAGKALLELRVRQVLWVRPPQGPLRRRRLPAVRLWSGGRHRKLVIQLGGRVFLTP